MEVSIQPSDEKITRITQASSRDIMPAASRNDVNDRSDIIELQHRQHNIEMI